MKTHVLVIARSAATRQSSPVIQRFSFIVAG